MNHLKRSVYFETLSGLVQERYLSKLEDVGGLDPYALLKKSLRAGNNFVASEKVSSLESRWIQNKSNYILRCRVEPSMRSTEPARRPWAIVSKLGIILSAHCDCAAGLGEACSHVSAMLFCVRTFRKSRIICSVTDEPAYWRPPSERIKATMSCIRHINFTTPERLLHNMIHGKEHVVRAPTTKYPALSDDEYERMIQACFKSAPGVVHTLVNPFSAQIIAKRPKSLKDLYHESHEEKSLEELRDIAAGVDLSLSQEEIDKIELETRKQAKGKAFYKRRIGRAPASKFKAICRTSTEGKISMSLLKSLVDPYHSRFTTEATRYGCIHEKDALAAYRQQMVKSHQKFTLTNCGSFCNADYPEFIGTPDALVSCTCCGKGCCEVKCPMCLEESDENDLSQTLEKGLASFPVGEVLDEVTGNLVYKLKETHAYFYQVQCQLFLTGRAYSDFVVWTPKNKPIIIRLEPDIQFWERESAKAKFYIRNIVLPELLGKYFTRQERRELEEERQKGGNGKITGVAKRKKNKKNIPPASPLLLPPNSSVPQYHTPVNISNIISSPASAASGVSNTTFTLPKTPSKPIPIPSRPCTPIILPKTPSTSASPSIIRRTFTLPKTPSTPIPIPSSPCTPTILPKTPSSSISIVSCPSTPIIRTTFIPPKFKTPNTSSSNTPAKTRYVIIKKPSNGQTQTPGPDRKPLSTLNLGNILNRVSGMNKFCQ
ncbi:hypothetical protein FOCC_FOCC007004 [Frankliniella occidentalis]|nr:hypothetical protein FOCC_FOCC007004 [Frankliniella occidentalis]